jgi:hypothetical protein
MTTTIYHNTNIGSRSYYAHRIIMGCTDRKTKVDHINHDTLDNRKANLRITQNENNSKHRKGKNSNNKSGYRNVCWLKKYGKWVVLLQINGVNTILEKFDDVDEAGSYAEEMRQKYYGEFAGND